MVRRELREHIFKVLFQIEFVNMEDMKEHLTLYFEYLKEASEEEKQQIKNKFEAIAVRVAEIDNILNEKITGWKTTRMNKADLTILRLAVYEMMWDEDVPTGVAINEAVELAKKFSGEEGPSFVNGVLAKLTD
jgi:N utilization substance protein B